MIRRNSGFKLNTRMLEITDLSVFENYESNNKQTTGALLGSVRGIDFIVVYILLADKKTGYVKCL